MIQTIAEQLPRLRESIDKSAPAEVSEIFLREQRTLASVTPEAVIEPELGCPTRRCSTHTVTPPR